MNYPAINSIVYHNAPDIESVEALLSPLRHFVQSFGIRPFRVIVSRISKDELSKKQTLQLLFAVKKEITSFDIDYFINRIQAEKDYPLSSLAEYRKAFEYSVNSKDRSGRNWTTRQTYAGLDVLISVLSEKGISSNVLSSFDHTAYYELQESGEDGYTPAFAVVAEIPESQKKQPGFGLPHTQLAQNGYSLPRVA